MKTPLFVEITEEPIEPGRPYTDKKTGMQKMIPGKQNAYLHFGPSYPLPFKVDVDDTVGPLRPGRYMLAGDCFKPGQYGLDFNNRNLVLVPLEDGVAALTGTKPKLAAAS